MVFLQGPGVNGSALNPWGGGKAYLEEPRTCQADSCKLFTPFRKKKTVIKMALKTEKMSQAQRMAG
jgi:hypothetical protein